MSYNPNVVFPEEISRGAEFSIGYDTHILELESGFLHRVPRMAPWGRRTYTFSKNSCTTVQANAIRRFFMLRHGASESFKFKDWSDYATTSTGYVDTANQINFTDMALQHISGTNYQCVKTISDAGGSVVRPIEKIKAGTFRIGVNGTEIFSPSYTVDLETGIVTVSGSLGPLTNVTAGFEFYTVVHFSEETDKRMTTTIDSVLSNGSVQSITLVEDLSRASVTQYQHMGGAISQLVPNDSYVTLTMLNGRFQEYTFGNTGSNLRLPPITNIPDGGPIFVVSCLSASGVNHNELMDNDGNAIRYLNTGDTVHVFAVTQGALKFWVVTT